MLNSPTRRHASLNLSRESSRQLEIRLDDLIGADSRHASGMFSNSQQFTVTGKTFTNITNHNYTAAPSLPSGTSPPVYLPYKPQYLCRPPDDPAGGHRSPTRNTCGRIHRYCVFTTAASLCPAGAFCQSDNCGPKIESDGSHLSRERRRRGVLYFILEDKSLSSL